MRRWIFIALACAACDSEPAAAPAAPPVPAEPVDPNDALAVALDVEAHAQGGMLVGVTPIMRAELATGEHWDFQVVVPGGACARFMSAHGPRVERFDLTLYDENGVLLQRDQDPAAQPTLGVEQTVCPQRTTQYRIRARMEAGSGEIAVRGYRRP